MLGPVLWVLALSAGAVAFHYSWAVALGLLVTAASFLAALLVLGLLRARRRREERRYADAG